MPPKQLQTTSRRKQPPNAEHAAVRITVSIHPRAIQIVATILAAWIASHL